MLNIVKILTWISDERYKWKFSDWVLQSRSRTKTMMNWPCHTYRVAGTYRNVVRLNVKGVNFIVSGQMKVTVLSQ